MKTFKSGYVDPETNRVALTAKEFYANGDACDEWLYIYLNDGISYLTDPWRIADGMDAKTDYSEYYIWIGEKESVLKPDDIVFVSDKTFNKYFKE